MFERIDGISIAEDDLGIGDEIEAELLRSLRQDLPQAHNGTFVLSAKAPHNGLVGGLVASTSYGWLLVKSIWVAEAHRNRSLGRILLECAEERARTNGCHGAWLDTSNPAARDFYARLGYEVFGQLANALDQHPADHRRWFMKKIFP